jgi:3-isopropylmalate/(R)-2-methylmalate dehydratase small subunit
MEPFRTHRGKIAILNDDDIDTDRIIPARFLSMVTRSGYGNLLFHDVRKDGFPLDAPEAQGATVLIVGTNFGCGSSREHAVWAIQQSGFKAVVARKTEESEGFSDIFRQNSANNGLLLVEVNADAHEAIVGLGPGAEIEIDLTNQRIQFGGRSAGFEIHPATKHALTEGLDLIGTTLLHEEAITDYERMHGAWAPTNQKS